MPKQLVQLAMPAPLPTPPQRSQSPMSWGFFWTNVPDSRHSLHGLLETPLHFGQRSRPRGSTSLNSNTCPRCFVLTCASLSWVASVLMTKTRESPSPVTSFHAPTLRLRQAPGHSILPLSHPLATQGAPLVPVPPHFSQGFVRL